MRRFFSFLLSFTCASVLFPEVLQGEDILDEARGLFHRGATDDARRLARKIDEMMMARWARDHITPALFSTDAEFLRRVSLDIAGRIPKASEAQAFLDDSDPDKRIKLVQILLKSPAFANHMANVWKELLIPETSGDSDAGVFAADFGVWLRKQFADGVAYDRMVTELLTASVRDGVSVFDPERARNAKPSPFAFLAAKQGKPENLAAATSRVFLGIRLECAQCHDDPFHKWKREQFWGLAAFFAGVEIQSTGDGFLQGTDTPDRFDLTIPGTNKPMAATFLDGKEPARSKGIPARMVLAGWLASRENPYFAKATVNRLWAQFFGVGLVDPVDDMGDDNEPSHPELLNLLADELIAHNFDLRYLIGAIAASRTYQLSSAGGPVAPPASQRFERMPVRGMSPVQLYDSLIQATGLKREPTNLVTLESPRDYFLEQFTSLEERPADRRTSIPQALILMNSELVTEATTLGRGKTLTAIAEAPHLDTTGKLEALYLAALSRRPRPDEMDWLVRYVERGRAGQTPKEALADIFWSLLGSAEFVFNH